MNSDSNIDVDEEVPLYSSTNRRERELYDEQANLYAIIVATEHLERAYARDAISANEYTSNCKKLLSQFRLAEKGLKMSTNGVMTTETFMELYMMNNECPRAIERLLKVGVPEPTKSSAGSGGGNNNGSGGGDGNDGGNAIVVAETVQQFITAMDAVKLEQRAVDEIQPLLSDLYDSLATRFPDINPTTFGPAVKIQSWLSQLNALRAVDEISENDSRQLYFDLVRISMVTGSRRGRR
jgi:ESCRT-I complex subunit VPS28